MSLKKIFKKISKAANKVADKLVPKEIAPFLPILGAFAPGLGLAGTGVFNQFILPQLLTAASSAKLQGEIDPTQQAITGILSALQTPQTQTKAEKALLGDSELARQLRMADVDASKTIITDPIELQKLADANKIEGLNVFQGKDVLGPGIGDPGSKPFGGFFDDFLGGPFQPGDAMGPQRIFSFDTPEGTRFFRPDSKALNEFLLTAGETPDLSKLTGDALRERVVADTTLTDKSFARRLGDLQDTLGPERGLQALNRARGFFDSPVGFNAPTFTKVGIGSLPFLAAEAANLQAEDEAAQAEADAQAATFAGAQEDLFEYFKRLSDPQGLFAATGGRVGAQEGGIMSTAPGMPQGMQVDGRNGTFIPMGVKEKADDVPAMLSKNEFVMTADAVRAMGNGDVNEGAQRMYDLMNSLEARA